MKQENRFQGTQTYLSANWPTYLLGYGGGTLLALFLLILAAGQGWIGLVLILFALLLLLAYFLAAAVWAAYQIYDVRGQRPPDVLFELGRLGPTARFAHVGLGRRQTAVQMSRRLTGGQITVVDVYNPQLAPNPALARARIPAGSRALPGSDPRLQWRDGQIDLLPLPDGCVPTVTVDRTLGELWAHGDRLLLLREIRRILVPGGRLVLAEEARTRAALLAWGPPALRRPDPSYWRALVMEAGFRVRQERDVRGLLHYLVAEKPHAGEMEQLTFDFGL